MGVELSRKELRGKELDPGQSEVTWDQDLTSQSEVTWDQDLVFQSEVTWDQDPTSQSEVTGDAALCVEDAALAEKSVDLVGVDELPLGEPHVSLGGRDVLEVHAEGVGEVNQGITFISQN